MSVNGFRYSTTVSSLSSSPHRRHTDRDYFATSPSQQDVLGLRSPPLRSSRRGVNSLKEREGGSTVHHADSIDSARRRSNNVYTADGYHGNDYDDDDEDDDDVVYFSASSRERRLLEASIENARRGAQARLLSSTSMPSHSAATTITMDSARGRSVSGDAGVRSSSSATTTAAVTEALLRRLDAAIVDADASRRRGNGHASKSVAHGIAHTVVRLPLQRERQSTTTTSIGTTTATKVDMDGGQKNEPLPFYNRDFGHPYPHHHHHHHRHHDGNDHDGHRPLLRPYADRSALPLVVDLQPSAHPNDHATASAYVLPRPSVLQSNASAPHHYDHPLQQQQLQGERRTSPEGPRQVGPPLPTFSRPLAGCSSRGGRDAEPAPVQVPPPAPSLNIIPAAASRSPPIVEDAGAPATEAIHVHGTGAVGAVAERPERRRADAKHNGIGSKEPLVADSGSLSTGSRRDDDECHTHDFKEENEEENASSEGDGEEENEEEDVEVADVSCIPDDSMAGSYTPVAAATAAAGHEEGGASRGGRTGGGALTSPMSTSVYDAILDYCERLAATPPPPPPLTTKRDSMISSHDLDRHDGRPKIPPPTPLFPEQRPSTARAQEHRPFSSSLPPRPTPLPPPDRHEGELNPTADPERGGVSVGTQRTSFSKEEDDHHHTDNDNDDVSSSIVVSLCTSSSEDDADERHANDHFRGDSQQGNRNSSDNNNNNNDKDDRASHSGLKHTGTFDEVRATATSATSLSALTVKWPPAPPSSSFLLLGRPPPAPPPHLMSSVRGRGHRLLSPTTHGSAANEDGSECIDISTYDDDDEGDEILRRICAAAAGSRPSSRTPA